MITEELIEKNINAIQKDENKLYSYLWDLFWFEKCENVEFLEGICANFLEDTRSHIKIVAIKILLSGLQIKNDNYKDRALSYVNDVTSDFDLRITSISGLGETYKGTKDKDLISKFYELFNDENENPLIRSSLFGGLMNFLGLGSVEILFQNDKLIISLDDINLSLFGKELEEINRIINNRPEVKASNVLL